MRFPGGSLLTGVALVGLLGCSPEAPVPEPDRTSTASPSSTTRPSSTAMPTSMSFEPPTAAVCPAVTVAVTTATELQTALSAARPGDVIGLADGTYAGNFTVTTKGTEASPIFLCGSERAVLDAGGIKEGYVLHLDGAAFWRVVGIMVRNGQKGVMADAVQHTVLQGLTVELTGDEAVHFRRGSSDNIIRDSTIRDTGHRRAKFGEGVYLGTATSNWCTISDCQPDRSDRNLVIGNTITQTTAESVDLKEGTSDGVVFGNTFDGAALTGADSWLDAKGNRYLVAENEGAHSPVDGFQTHDVEDGWGRANTFTANWGADLATASDEGVLIGLHPDRDTVLGCDNRVLDDSAPLTNVDGPACGR